MIGAGWLAATVALYAAAAALHRRAPVALLSPLLTAPAALAAALLAGRVPYRAYMGGGRWLADLLGPTTVAFAVPLWRSRDLLRRHARELSAGLLAGCAVAVGSSVELARMAGLDGLLVASLAPRSITTPLAMEVATRLGGSPALAAVFVIATALVGLVLGDLGIRHLPLRSPLARGALLGMGAHGAGTAQALALGPVEGAIAGLTMISAGLLVIAAVPAIRLLIHA